MFLHMKAGKDFVFPIVFTDINGTGIDRRRNFKQKGEVKVIMLYKINRTGNILSVGVVI